MYSLDGSAAEYQEQDKVKQQEATPDQQSDMYDPDAFIGRMKIQQKPGFGSGPPDKEGGQVPSEAGIKEKVFHALSLSGCPGCEKDHCAVDYRDDDDPEPLFSD